VNSRGVVAVSGKDREVSQADIDRAVDAARAINISQDREILHVLPQAFAIDDADGVREPLGMSGVRLEVEVHVVTAAISSVQNGIRSVTRAGLSVQDVVLEPIASAEAVLYPDEKELGVLVIDIGGGTTDLAVLRDGAVWHTAILPLGGDHISNDIAVGLRTPMADAEALKKRCRSPGGGGGGRRAACRRWAAASRASFRARCSPRSSSRVSRRSSRSSRASCHARGSRMPPQPAWS